MKSLVAINGIGLVASTSINLLLMAWTKYEFLKSQLEGLPVPAFTLMVFNHRYALFFPIIIYLLAVVLLIRFNQIQRRGMVAFLTGATFVAIIITNLIVTFACLLLWIRHLHDFW
jgi:phosphotransferase system  glucose/maltose/N-acetylglucosamine-specific IIC component